MTRSKLFALLGAVVLVISALTIPNVAAQTAAADSDLAGGGHFYTQANGGAGPQFGYRITDEGGIKFWSEFQRLGGVNALGYPSSRRFTLDGFTVQATQKVIMQWRPEVNQVYFVNVFDKLHDQGSDAPLQATYQVPSQLDPSFDAGKTPEQIQAARLALLNADPAIAARYNAAGALAILYYGLPTSKVTDEGPFVMLRAQRIAIQHWKAANPAAGIKAGDVTVVNGGDVAKKLNLVPAPAQITETSGGEPAATPAPAAPSATPTPASTLQYRAEDVTQPPVDCSNDPKVNSIPCYASAPNAGSQYIKGRVLDINGKRLSGVTVQATVDGQSSTVQSAGDATFTFNIAGAGSPTGSCPKYTLTYQLVVLDNNGAVASDPKTIVYSGDCSQAGEFHFDFVKVR